MDETGPMRKDGIECQKLEEEWMLYDPQTGCVHVLNAVAEVVWRMCDGRHSIGEMAQQIAAAYEVPEGADVLADVQSVIESFAERGMLEGGC